jgi:polyphosphate kinase 2 (PPK2 family)
LPATGDIVIFDRSWYNQARIDDGGKIGKLSDMDLKSYSRWYDCSKARDDRFLATDTSWAAWHVAHSDDERRVVPEVA